MARERETSGSFKGRWLSTKPIKEHESRISEMVFDEANLRINGSPIGLVTNVKITANYINKNDPTAIAPPEYTVEFYTPEYMKKVKGEADAG